MIKSKYHTRQQELLVAFLKETHGKHFTAEDVRIHFEGSKSSIGIATVYRHLEKLASDGIVTKYVIDEHSAACYEYTGDCAHEDSEPHFHLKCEVCGTLIHLECDELFCIQSHLQKDHGFTLNPLRTVFYGICADCKKKEQDSANAEQADKKVAV